MAVLITGGAGFIGSHFVDEWLANDDEPLVNLDALTYAGNLANLAPVKGDARHKLVRGNIGDRALVLALLHEHQPRAVINFAAETHVDRSIHAPDAFIQTNVVGVLHLLESVQTFWSGLSASRRAGFRFLQVSTDEVYGSLAATDAGFTERHPFAPNSPYSASKASGDHLVRAWHHTYGLPTLTTHCSNNYGPRQFPEKLIPLILLRALAGSPLPVYGDGQHVRDWLYVLDHCRGVRRVLDAGRIGERYNIGGENEKTNLEVVHALCALLDEVRPKALPYAAQITFVKDRPGHDRRYAINPERMRDELGWRPFESFESGLRTSVLWYLENQAWVDGVLSGAYRSWVDRLDGPE